MPGKIMEYCELDSRSRSDKVVTARAPFKNRKRGQLQHHPHRTDYIEFAPAD